MTLDFVWIQLLVDLEFHYKAWRFINGAPIYPTNTDIDNYIKFVMDSM